MNIYPNIRIQAPNYDRKRSDGRVNSNAVDGTPRSQILYPRMLHTFKVQHFLLTESERAVVEGFYGANAAHRFIYHCEFDDKQYVCTFLDAPTPSEHVGDKCHLTVSFSGFEYVG